jgi:hypothetical protein
MIVKFKQRSSMSDDARNNISIIMVPGLPRRLHRSGERVKVSIDDTIITFLSQPK